MSNELITVISGIRSDIQAIEEDADIYDEIHFGPRADIIDFIDFHIIDRIEGVLTSGPNIHLDHLKQQAGKAKQRLEEIDIKLFKRLREDVSYWGNTQNFFRTLVHKYMGDVVSAAAGKVGYDNLDIFINGLLFDHPTPEARKTRDPEMVFYQQTPARVIFELADRAGLTHDDVFFDIGSGVGHVPVLVNLLTGAKTRGIEYEPAYCEYATVCAGRLNLPDVKFINTAAQNGDYTEGNMFFMYTPFEGEMLRQMLALLKRQSTNRTIRIFTYGPCSPIIARQNWLVCINGPADNVYTLYEFRSLLIIHHLNNSAG